MPQLDRFPLQSRSPVCFYFSVNKCACANCPLGISEDSGFILAAVAVMSVENRASILSLNSGSISCPVCFYPEGFDFACGSRAEPVPCLTYLCVACVSLVPLTPILSACYSCKVSGS